jgi:trimeric autotransporter adhesin
MSDLLVEQLIRTFERLAERVHTAVADETSVRVEQLTAAIQADRHSTAEAAARDAAASAERAAVARLTADFAARDAATREAARTEGFDAGLAQGRAESAAALQEEQSRGETALAGAAAAHASALASAHAAHADALSEQRGRDAADSIGRVARALRVLNGSTTLSQTLDALSDAAAADGNRVALFLVRGATLRLWSQKGFAALDAEPAYELSLADATVLAEAVSTAEPRRIDEANHQTCPAFVGSASAALLVVPLALNGQVTALLCAEDASGGEPRRELAATLEVLVQYAARVLESLTAMRLAHASGVAPAMVVAPVTQRIGHA